mmetsp:Transcript_44472/g.100426  ORF Transcript_44472/g.100426 Transcript_44472/m.100426 type:complete len:576 (+) Transcript_44472:1713-3440(+)
MCTVAEAGGKITLRVVGMDELSPACQEDNPDGPRVLVNDEQVPPSTSRRLENNDTILIGHAIQFRLGGVESRPMPRMSVVGDDALLPPTVAKLIKALEPPESAQRTTVSSFPHLRRLVRGVDVSGEFGDRWKQAQQLVDRANFITRHIRPQDLLVFNLQLCWKGHIPATGPQPLDICVRLDGDGEQLLVWTVSKFEERLLRMEDVYEDVKSLSKEQITRVMRQSDFNDPWKEMGVQELRLMIEAQTFYRDNPDGSTSAGDLSARSWSSTPRPVVAASAPVLGGQLRSPPADDDESSQSESASEESYSESSAAEPVDLGPAAAAPKAPAITPALQLPSRSRDSDDWSAAGRSRPPVTLLGGPSSVSELKNDVAGLIAQKGLLQREIELLNKEMEAVLKDSLEWIEANNQQKHAELNALRQAAENGVTPIVMRSPAPISGRSWVLQSPPGDRQSMPTFITRAQLVGGPRAMSPFNRSSLPPGAMSPPMSRASLRPGQMVVGPGPVPPGTVLRQVSPRREQRPGGGGTDSVQIRTESPRRFYGVRQPGPMLRPGSPQEVMSVPVPPPVRFLSPQSARR